MRSLLKEKDYSRVLEDGEWTEKAHSEFNNIRNAILSKPLLRRACRSKRPYLRTDISVKGMGFVILQPDDETESIVAMHREDAGGSCEFDLTLKGLRLLPCAFGSRMCCGPEIYFHSYYGEAMALRFGINKNRHILYGRPFTNIGDCIALRWIMYYTGDNPVINRIQMELMSWWFTIVHRPNRLVIDTDYFSRLAADIHIDPLLTQYFKISEEMYTSHPPPANSTHVENENLPNYRGRRTGAESIELGPDTVAHLTTIDIEPHESPSTLSLTNVPISFVHHKVTKKAKLHHTARVATAYQLLQHDWAPFSFRLPDMRPYVMCPCILVLVVN